MSGIPQFNYPAFDSAAKRLRGLGLEVISPTELHSQMTWHSAMSSPDGDPERRTGSESWAELLAVDLRAVVEQSDRIALLSGWHRSKGARIEVFAGLLHGHAFYKYERMVGLVPMAHWQIKERLL